ncbi:hypothetical protein QCA50_006175 [Cerrena zonata]|uniref:Uncharacterized protein n=1 Tax=Cerrena zonata TaxID=2478898 RepID=A0AAW0GEX7_9APHY
MSTMWAEGTVCFYLSARGNDKDIHVTARQVVPPIDSDDDNTYESKNSKAHEDVVLGTPWPLSGVEGVTNHFHRQEFEHILYQRGL